MVYRGRLEQGENQGPHKPYRGDEDIAGDEIRTTEFIKHVQLSNSIGAVARELPIERLERLLQYAKELNSEGEEGLNDA